MRLNLFKDYESMDSDAIISSALDIYADESTMKSEYGEVLQINTLSSTYGLGFVICVSTVISF